MKKTDETVYILLATYNGEAYIEEQLDSIVKQKLSNWRLIIRDDGSKDRTISIINKFAKFDERIIVIRDDINDRGAKNNFSTLLHCVKKYNPYYLCFSDQDDLWDSDKLLVEFEKIKEKENKFGPQTPILIHTDLEVVDENMRQICNSFMNYHGVAHKTHMQLEYLLIQNFVTGCTLMFNRALFNLSVPIPKCVVMHDWWIALCASAFGYIFFIPDATVRYRQHASNVIGAKSKWKQLAPSYMNWKIKLRQACEDFNETIDQAFELKKRWAQIDELKNGSGFRLLSDYLNSMSIINPFYRVYRIAKMGMRRQYALTTLFYYISVFRYHSNPNDFEIG